MNKAMKVMFSIGVSGALLGMEADVRSGSEERVILTRENLDALKDYMDPNMKEHLEEGLPSRPEIWRASL